jgi:4-hydroxybenzoate polyprenyltransferase
MNRRLLPYLQLVRLPNVFTAMADIVLGALATGVFTVGDVAGEELSVRVGRFLLLLFASCFLYCSGMVWNDYFDIKQDERERPFRPLPSGKVKRSTAFVLAAGLMIVGVALSLLADFNPEENRLRWFSTWIALALCAAILVYDGGLKRTWAGPVGMGACRFLNVLLGISVFPTWPGRYAIVLAAVVGVYIVGVTWFARTEARESKRTELALAAGIMAVALVLALLLPPLYPGERQEEPPLPSSSLVVLGQLLFPFLLVAFAAYLGIAIAKAIRQPTPGHVQKAVKRCILGLVALDAILATVFVGPLALALLALLLPARYLGKWIYST